MLYLITFVYAVIIEGLDKKCIPCDHVFVVFTIGEIQVLFNYF